MRQVSAARVEAAMRLLVDSGDATPQALHITQQVTDTDLEDYVVGEITGVGYLVVRHSLCGDSVGLVTATDTISGLVEQAELHRSFCRAA